MQVFALVDGNSFFASCEKVFRPDLTDRPVIVLSNNDGCVVARSKEAKKLGIKMCQPYFQIEEFCIRENVAVFSSNYELYANLSGRMMSSSTLIRALAFLILFRIPIRLFITLGDCLIKLTVETASINAPVSMSEKSSRKALSPRIFLKRRKPNNSRSSVN